MLEQVNIPLLKGNIDQAIMGADGNLNANGNGSDSKDAADKKSKKKKINEAEAKKLETLLHDVVELVLRPYFQ